MLAKGIQLTIMIGPVVPIPVPQMVMDALDSVQVTTAAGSAQRLSDEFTVQQQVGVEHVFHHRRRDEQRTRYAAAARHADRHSQWHAAAAV